MIKSKGNKAGKKPVEKAIQTVSLPNQIISLKPQKLQKIIEHQNILGVLECATGVGAKLVGDPAGLILSAGHLAQAVLKKKFYQQLLSEVHKYRDEGKMSDKSLDSPYGKTIFTDFMRIMDSETLDDEKFNALKFIFFHSVKAGTDEHDQLLAYQYFQVCKKLSSLDILILKTAYKIYEEPGSNQPSGGTTEWETRIYKKLGIPEELISQSRIENSAVSQTPKSSIFETEVKHKHGLTVLGIAIGEFIKGF